MKIEHALHFVTGNNLSKFEKILQKFFELKKAQMVKIDLELPPVTGNNISKFDKILLECFQVNVQTLFDSCPLICSFGNPVRKSL